jgi:hypothetical protein
MSVDSQHERDDVSVEWIEHQLRAFSAAEPPGGLKERLLTAAPHGSTAALQWRLWRRPIAVGWAGLAATIVLVSGVLWIRTPWRPSVRPTVEVNTSLGQALAADHNSVRPPDINALDSNGLY